MGPMGHGSDGTSARHAPGSHGSAAGPPARASDGAGRSQDPPSSTSAAEAARCSVVVGGARVGRSAAVGVAPRRRADARTCDCVRRAGWSGSRGGCPAPEPVRAGEKAVDDTAVAAARQSFVGEWKLNKALSDDPRAKMREGRPERGPGGWRASRRVDPAAVAGAAALAGADRRWWLGRRWRPGRRRTPWRRHGSGASGRPRRPGGLGCSSRPTGSRSRTSRPRSRSSRPRVSCARCTRTTRATATAAAGR